MFAEELPVAAPLWLFRPVAGRYGLKRLKVPRLVPRLDEFGSTLLAALPVPHCGEVLDPLLPELLLEEELEEPPVDVEEDEEEEDNDDTEELELVLDVELVLEVDVDVDEEDEEEEPVEETVVLALPTMERPRSCRLPLNRGALIAANRSAATTPVTRITC